MANEWQKLLIHRFLRGVITKLHGKLGRHLLLGSDVEASLELIDLHTQRRLHSLNKEDDTLGAPQPLSVRRIYKAQWILESVARLPSHNCRPSRSKIRMGE